MTEEQWGVYQHGMRSGIEFPANWVARKLPLSKPARAMLEIGGGTLLMRRVRESAEVKAALSEA
jgi:hypothetical protein